MQLTSELTNQNNFAECNFAELNFAECNIVEHNFDERNFVERNFAERNIAARNWAERNFADFNFSERNFAVYNWAIRNWAELLAVNRIKNEWNNLIIKISHTLLDNYYVIKKQTLQNQVFPKTSIDNPCQCNSTFATRRPLKFPSVAFFLPYHFPNFCYS